MKHVGLAALLLWAVASEVSAQSRGPATKGPAHGALPASAASATHQTFTKYCADCHGTNRPKAGLSITRVIEQMSELAVGEQGDAWLAMARMLETRQMPPDDARRAARPMPSGPRRPPGSEPRSTRTKPRTPAIRAA